MINPGALSISSNITLEPGADLLSGSFSSGLGLNEEAGIEGASEALLIEPEESVNPVGALIISIPLSSSALRLNGVIYSVLYEVFDYKNNRYQGWGSLLQKSPSKTAMLVLRVSILVTIRLLLLKYQLKKRLSLNQIKNPHLKEQEERPL